MIITQIIRLSSVISVSLKHSQIYLDQECDSFDTQILDLKSTRNGTSTEVVAK